MRQTQARGALSGTGRAGQPRDRLSGAHSASAGRKKLAGAGILIVGLVVVAALGALIMVAVRGCQSAPEPQGPGLATEGQIEVQIPEGAGTDVIAQAFVDARLVSDAATFTKAVAAAKADQSLKPGTYVFAAGTPVEAIVDQLTKGPNTSANRVTVPEGLTVAKTAAAVESALGIPAQDFMDQAKASLWVEPYPFLAAAQDDSLEGFLWASTYDFSGSTVDARSVIKAMLDRYQQAVSKVDFAAGEAAIQQTYNVTMTDYDILKMASIIEREAVSESDRPLVASVLYNRLRDGMALQSDATMGYVTGGEVTADDLLKESPYNSYLNKGLPPTPICTPSIECIQAALAPASTNYYYFLIIENGSYSNHTFSQTYEEHLAAIDKAKADQGA